MKAYVIKNKEGKYFKQCFDNGYVDFTDNILSCELYAKRIGAESTRDFIFRNAYKFNIEDYEVVEITIAEGNLEQELVNYKQALELACENIRDMYCSDYCVCTRDERCKGKCCYEQYYDKEKILNQAKKELEKGGE